MAESDYDRLHRRSLVMATLALLLGVGLGAAVVAAVAQPSPRATKAAPAIVMAQPGSVTAAAVVADPLSTEPVAVVAGQPITLRQLEDALLKKEGADQVKDWVADRVDQVPWETIDDTTPILAVAGSVLTRRDLARRVMKKGAGDAREDLIGTLMTEQALAKAGIVISQALLDAEFARVERRFQAGLTAKGKPIVPYADYVRQRYNQSLDEFKGQRAFRLAAGLHGLVLREAQQQLKDSEIEAWFNTNRSRFDETEAVDLSTIYMAFPQNGRDVAGNFSTPADRDALASVFRTLYVQIVRGETSYETLWKQFGQGWEKTRPGGRVGWVGRDGRRDLPDSRVIPSEVVALAFAAAKNEKLPHLCLPIAGPEGIDLLKIHAWRPQRTVTLAEVRDQVIQALVEDQLDQRTSELLHRIRRDTEIDYKSLPNLIRKRFGEEQTEAPSADQIGR